MAAFCMAVFFRGLTHAETFAMTDAMVQSGTRSTCTARSADRRRQALDGRRRRQDLDRGRAARRRVRRAVREDERPRPRAHGRDARQARVDPGVPRRASRWTSSSPGARRRCGDHRPDRQPRPGRQGLYALRDVTGTVDNVQLIAASIMSKKIAAGADAIVLDVKVGDGAFMKTLEDARLLADTMRELGERAGRRVACLLTDMDQPLGRAVGNALGLLEARATLRGEAPDFTELVLTATGQLLAFSDLGVDADEGRRRAEAAGRTGRRSRRTTAGSARRAATRRGRAPSTRRPYARGARGGVRPRAARAPGRDRRARARRGRAQGRRDRPRGRHRLPRKRGDRSSAASRSPRSTRTPTRRRTPRPTACSRPTSSASPPDDRPIVLDLVT